LQRAKEAIKNDDNFKTNKDLDKFLENISIIENDLISIFEKNRIKKIDTKDKKFDPNFHQAMSEIEMIKQSQVLFLMKYKRDICLVKDC
jgi:molecular chaperone GrpE